jgi:hypothetical protein
MLESPPLARPSNVTASTVFVITVNGASFRFNVLG